MIAAPLAGHHLKVAAREGCGGAPPAKMGKRGEILLLLPACRAIGGAGGQFLKGGGGGGGGGPPRRKDGKPRRDPASAAGLPAHRGRGREPPRHCEPDTRTRAQWRGSGSRGS